MTNEGSGLKFRLCGALDFQMAGSFGPGREIQEPRPLTAGATGARSRVSSKQQLH